jgi:hypothetical protein
MTARILMCPPDHYGIEYEINPWMSRQRPADRKLAIEQWQGLASLVKFAGAEVELVSPVAGLPDLVFTANAAMIFGCKAILAHFRHYQRQGEEPFYEAALTHLRRHPVRGLSGPQRRARTSTNRRTAASESDSARNDRLVLLPPRHVLLPTRGRRGDLFSWRFRRIR